MSGNCHPELRLQLPLLHNHKRTWNLTSKEKRIKLNNWSTDGHHKLRCIEAFTFLFQNPDSLPLNSHKKPFWRDQLQFGTNVKIIPRDESKHLNSSKFPLEADHTATSSIMLHTQTVALVAPKSAATPALSTLCGPRESLYPTAQGNTHTAQHPKKTLPFSWRCCHVFRDQMLVPIPLPQWINCARSQLTPASYSEEQCQMKTLKANYMFSCLSFYFPRVRAAPIGGHLDDKSPSSAESQ